MRNKVQHFFRRRFVEKNAEESFVNLINPASASTDSIYSPAKKTFKPKKKIPSGSRLQALHNYSKATQKRTLGNGLDLRQCVALVTRIFQKYREIYLTASLTQILFFSHRERIKMSGWQ